MTDDPHKTVDLYDCQRYHILVIETQTGDCPQCRTELNPIMKRVPAGSIILKATLEHVVVPSKIEPLFKRQAWEK